MFTEPLLGSQCNDPEVHKEFIASKGPDAEAAAEEMAALPTEEQVEKALQVFPRGPDGMPILWDYQIKGFFKDACGMLSRCGEEADDAPPAKGEKAKRKVPRTESGKLRAYKKIVDGLVFVAPRQIKLMVPEDYETKIKAAGGKLDTCTRPLRGQTPQGERVCLVTSELVPAGTQASFTVSLLNEDHEDALREWLEYGELRGLGQWRNSGMGRFTWTTIEAGNHKA
jgi:hypothetical protein